MNREERVTEILTYVASSNGPCSVIEITKKLNITQSSVSRVLSSLETLQWVSRSAHGYTIGDRLLTLSFRITSGLDVIKICRPYLDELQRATNETVVLYLRVGNIEICVDKSESNHPVQHVVLIGSEVPLWSSCAGKVVLANLNRDEVEEVFDGLIKSGIKTYLTGRSLDIDKIRKELEIIRKRGYSVTSGELKSEVAAVASPIFENNRVKGAIVITGPIYRFNMKTAQKFSPLVVRATRKINRLLGSTL